MQKEHRVSVSHGCYTLVDNGRCIDVAFSNGNLCPSEFSEFYRDRAIQSMMCELDAARVVLREVRKLVSSSANESKDGVIWRLKKVLEHHGDLCGDDAEPSDWCEIDLTPERDILTNDTSSSENGPKHLPDNLNHIIANVVMNTLAETEPTWTVKHYREVCGKMTRSMIGALQAKFKG